MKDIPAYPQYVINNGGAHVDGGMTLRDYFAAKAMQGLLSDPDWRKYMNFEETAYAAYKQANAMMKARQSNG
jgi:hypothetical protein